MIPSCSQPQNCAGGSTSETILKSGICRLVTSENFVMKHRVRLTLETVLHNLRKMMFLSFAFQNPITRQIRWGCSVCAKKMKPKRSAPWLLQHIISVSTRWSNLSRFICFYNYTVPIKPEWEFKFNFIKFAGCREYRTEVGIQTISIPDQSGKRTFQTQRASERIQSLLRFL